MEIIFKAVAFSVITVVCVILTRQFRAELSVFIELAGLFLLLMISFEVIESIVSFTKDFIENEIIDKEYITLLLKALAIAIIAKIGGDICRDSGNSTLAFGVELVGKALVLSLVLPMLKNIASITSGLLGKG